MKNITVSVPEDVYRKARIVAAERGRSLSALVAEFLGQLSAKDAELARRRALQEKLFAELDGDPNHRFNAADRMTRDELYDRALH